MISRTGFDKVHLEIVGFDGGVSDNTAHLLGCDIVSSLECLWVSGRNLGPHLQGSSCARMIVLLSTCFLSCSTTAHNSVSLTILVDSMSVFYVYILYIIFVSLKLIRVSYVSFHAEFKYVTRISLSSTDFV